MQQHRSEHIKSPLRYPGGKSRGLSQILPLIGDFNEYREPFVGGGSVFLKLKQLLPACNYWINDINYDLYCFWSVAQNNIVELVETVRQIRQKTTSGRELYNQYKIDLITYTEFERAVRFFILNRITFSGTVDSGGYSEGAFNGRFTESSIKNLESVSDVLQNIQITHEDYSTLLFEAGYNVFLFLDPPYYSVTHSRLYGKNGDLHTGFDHERFAADMFKCEHRWLITYDDCPEIRNTFNRSGIYIVPWDLQYGMNNYKQERASSGKELFIANYDIRKLVTGRQLVLDF